MELLTQKEFAALIGVSPPAVNKMIKAGKIPIVNGKIPKTEGLAAYNASRNPSFDNHRSGFGGGAKSKSEQANPKHNDETVKPPPKKMQPSTMAVADVNEKFNQARMAEKVLDVKIKELEYQKKKSELIPAQEVKMQVGKLAAVVRQRFVNLPNRMSSILEGKDRAEIQKYLEDEVRSIMQEMSESLATGYGEDDA